MTSELSLLKWLKSAQCTSKLKSRPNKAAGIDHIEPEHLKFAHPLIVHLC